MIHISFDAPACVGSLPSDAPHHRPPSIRLRIGRVAYRLLNPGQLGAQFCGHQVGIWLAVEVVDFQRVVREVEQFPLDVTRRAARADLVEGIVVVADEFVSSGSNAVVRGATFIGARTFSRWTLRGTLFPEGLDPTHCPRANAIVLATRVCVSSRLRVFGKSCRQGSTMPDVNASEQVRSEQGRQWVVPKM